MRMPRAAGERARLCFQEFPVAAGLSSFFPPEQAEKVKKRAKHWETWGRMVQAHSHLKKSRQRERGTWWVTREGLSARFDQPRLGSRAVKYVKKTNNRWVTVTALELSMLSCSKYPEKFDKNDKNELQYNFNNIRFFCRFLLTAIFTRQVAHSYWKRRQLDGYYRLVYSWKREWGQIGTKMKNIRM